MTTIFKYTLKGHVSVNNHKVESWLVHVFNAEDTATCVVRILKNYLLEGNHKGIRDHDPEFRNHLDGDPVNGSHRIFWDVTKIEWADTCDGVMGHGTGERKGMQI